MAEEHAVIVLDDLEMAEGKRVEGARPFYFCITEDPANVTLQRVDLVPGNMEELLDILKPYLAVATQVKPKGKKLSGKKSSLVEVPARKSPAGGSGRSDAAAIREWAQRNGRSVSERGRIPNEVVQEYDRLHGTN